VNSSNGAQHRTPTAKTRAGTLPQLHDTLFYTNEHYPRSLASHRWYRRLIIRPRYQAIRRAVVIQAGSRILEVGCDGCILLRMLEQTGAQVYGMDVNVDAMRQARHSRISKATAEAMPFANATFHFCVASHVIEHLESPRDFLCEAARVLEARGKVLLVYPREMIQGSTTIPDIIFSGRIPTLALMRRIHRHRFTPARLQDLAHGLPLRHVHSSMFLGLPHLALQYLTVFQKI
jgi:SAM-dependent methyltransferase